MKSKLFLQCKQRIHAVLNTYYYLSASPRTTPYQHQLSRGDLYNDNTIGWHVFIGKNPGEILKLFSSLCYFPEPLFVSQSSWPWTLFVSGVSDLCPSIPYLCPQVPCLFPWVPYSFPRAPYWAAGALRVPCSLPWIHDVFPCMLYLDYCAHFAVYFLAFLLFPVLLICFLHRSFISGNSWFISPNRYFIVSVFHIDFPEFFSFPYPRASFKVLNFSAYFPEFRRLLYFLVYFDRFVFICLFLWILICFSESEPLYFLP